MGSSDEFSMGKTPISLLQEICNRREVTPQYDLVANEGAIHEPLFVFKVSAGDIVATGKGQSKKKAKHNAAVAALQLIGATSKESSKVDFIKHDEDAFGNPVGDLQEATQKKNWPPPVYEYSEGDGPPHARDFICNIKLFHYAEQAVGKSKKSAKRAAASAMLSRIKQGTLAPSDDYRPRRRYDYDHIDESNLMDMTDCPDRTCSPIEAPQAMPQINSKKPTERKKITPMFQTHSKAKFSRIVEKLHSLDLDKFIQLYDNYLDLCKNISNVNSLGHTNIDIINVSDKNSIIDNINIKVDKNNANDNFGKSIIETSNISNKNVENYNTIDAQNNINKKEDKNVNIKSCNNLINTDVSNDSNKDYIVENVFNNVVNDNVEQKGCTNLNDNCITGTDFIENNNGIDFSDWVFPDWESVEGKIDSHIYAEKFIKRLSNDENFLFDFIFSKNKSPQGMEMCLIRLTTFPVAVGCGIGETKEEAKYRSIFNMLSHLQMLTQKAIS